MRTVIAEGEQAADVDATVLITGESGVGQTQLARYIHDQSRRARAAFVSLNCGAISETLIESELFGHRRGAFTEALEDRVGLFGRQWRNDLPGPEPNDAAIAALKRTVVRDLTDIAAVVAGEPSRGRPRRAEAVAPLRDRLRWKKWQDVQYDRIVSARVPSVRRRTLSSSGS
jgi:hypothetical protein